ncbi:E3 ubiquitin-protein ligase WAVH1-like [Senna tora]|uniref:E3 ubiquitin-protein ligase WAVH1-like n=1 Tax=Senna tora TaxID=362788 RepID=A0A834XE71_9FABA|nr:E3 ubiquitin-protein ligase WAVH1-like [Senna tora]
MSIHNDKSSEQNRAHKLVHDFNNIRTLKVYSDDKPLMSPTFVARFNPIFESKEENQEPIEFQGFNVNTLRNNIEMCLLPEAAILAANRSHETYVVLLKLKAPSASPTEAYQPPIDLVTVLDIGGTMDGPKLQMMKQSMRIVILSLGSTNRLSIVVFSSGSKRLLPLRRMTSSGQRSARRIVDALATIDQSRDGACESPKDYFGDRDLERHKSMVADPWKMELLSVGDEEGGDVGSTTQRYFLLQLWMRDLLGLSVKGGLDWVGS